MGFSIDSGSLHPFITLLIAAPFVIILIFFVSAVLRVRKDVVEHDEDEGGNGPIA